MARPRPSRRPVAQHGIDRLSEDRGIVLQSCSEHRIGQFAFAGPVQRRRFGLDREEVLPRLPQGMREALLIRPDDGGCIGAPGAREGLLGLGDPGLIILSRRVGLCVMGQNVEGAQLLAELLHGPEDRHGPDLAGDRPTGFVDQADAEDRECPDPDRDEKERDRRADDNRSQIDLGRSRATALGGRHPN